jgi:hypothetical protein
MRTGETTINAEIAEHALSARHRRYAAPCRITLCVLFSSVVEIFRSARDARPALRY